MMKTENIVTILRVDYYKNAWGEEYIKYKWLKPYRLTRFVYLEGESCLEEILDSDIW